MMTDRLGEILNEVGWSRYLTYVFSVCSTAWFAYMAFASNMAIIMAELGKDWSLSTTSTGMMSTCFMIGTAFGSYLCGYLGDKYGRMCIFKATPFIALVGGIGQMLSYEYMMVTFYSVIIGFSIGGEIALGGTVWSEYCPPSKDWSMVLLATFWCFGTAFSGALALIFILIGSDSLEMWRCVVGVSIFFMLFAALLRLPLKETPRFLLNKGDYAELDEVLKGVIYTQLNPTRIDSLHTRLLDSTINFPETKHEEEAFIIPIKTESLIKELFSKNNMKSTIIFSMVYFGASYSFGGIFFFMPTLLSDIANTDLASTYEVIIFQQIFGIIGILLAAWLINTILGRKWSTAIPFFMSGVATLALFIIQDAMTLVICTSLYLMLSNIGWGAVYVIVPETYETKIRSFGVGWANAMANLGGLMAPVITGYMLEISFSITIVFLSLFTILVGIVAAFMKETKETKEF